MAQQPKVVIVGAGSFFFGRKAIWQMVHSPHLRTGTLALVDTDPSNLERMRQLAVKVRDHHKVPLKIEASTDRTEVLADADFVVLSFAERNAHFRGVDCRVSEKYGIRMCSGDTIGPGGVFRSARELPHVLRICADIKKLCPKAWVINYVNPTTVHGMAVRRYFPELKSLALCDAQWGLRRHWAEAAGVTDDEKLTILTAGPNHFTWTLKAEYDGRDILPKVVEHMRKAADADLNEQVDGGKRYAKGWLNNAIAVELYETLGTLPSVVSHTKEYVRYYQGLGRTGKDAIPPLMIFDSESRAEMTAKAWQQVDDFISGKLDIPTFDKTFGPDPATDIIEGMWGNLGKRFFINTANRGAVPNMSDDAFIELYSELDMNGPRPLPCPPMPRGIRGLCEQILDTHELTAQAIHDGDMRMLRRALVIDPLTSSIGDIDALLQDMLEEQGDAIEAQERYGIKPAGAVV
ncbi:MAG: hypothetical protein JJU36_10990 [Phycisphaeraceae bacterium]|nr:hypothetical protein [Phycisphaeraceae bacterium]